jgi:hypothetical protein
MSKYDSWKNLFKLNLNFYLEGTTKSAIKSGRSSDESIMIKRKHIDNASPSEKFTSSKTLTHSEPSKRPKTGIFFQRDSSVVNIKSSLLLPKIKFIFSLGATNSLYCPWL